jgi:hypothetical protein
MENLIGGGQNWLVGKKSPRQKQLFAAVSSTGQST